MPTLSEKQAINTFVNFLLEEFTAPETIDAAIANTITMIGVITQEYENAKAKSLFDAKGSFDVKVLFDAKGWLDKAYIKVKPDHLTKLTDTSKSLSNIQTEQIPVANKGQNALKALVSFFAASTHWEAPILTESSFVGKHVAQFFGKPITTDAAINHRVASFLIDKSSLDLATKLGMIERLFELNNKEIRNYFYSEIESGMRAKQKQLASAVVESGEQDVSLQAPAAMLWQPKDESSPRTKGRKSHSASPNLGRGRERRNSDFKYEL